MFRVAGVVGVEIYTSLVGVESVYQGQESHTILETEFMLVFYIYINIHFIIYPLLPPPF